MVIPGEAEVRKAVALMRELGIVRLDGIELGPEPQRPTPEPKPEQPPICACGHDPEIEHGPGGCLLGCSLTTCSEKPERTPE